MFALWDEDLPASERAAIASALIAVEPPADWETGKPVLPDNLPPKPRLHKFVGPRSWLIFHLLRVGTAWLRRRPVRKWSEDSEFVCVGDFLKDLHVVNDIAEQCVKNMTEYANTAKDSIHRQHFASVKLPQCCAAGHTEDGT